ncbi:hypothetical protein MYCTH_2314374 [Thermothelomyces thermophilus ATCC 42464]|uniref:DUF1264-domain-containing protein n=1 Tax=Thermothelomyces thermophilus (strain ATCC 42464 / BCRC 31852 / DSM 1799) TaxID=573729 RepID=G2Q080_THET4|nr:uncharacterized protein MYCTH_2314374 [Thermothelomyces thermophilus ATCC 42464]AEO55754.1 hypothetical protein MYCTH_2314374 [Thermothelomyces thermophilus ATCC 42464]
MASATHTKDRDAEPRVEGEQRSTKSTVLETGAAMTQDFSPLQNVCAHLNAFHVYASDPRRFVETNHYCGHLTEDVWQCLLYDSPSPGARLIGVEYMIRPHLYESLPQEERRLWHSHVFEVKSGMLVMPRPSSALVPQALWEKAETAEMGEVVQLYGKVYHLWQVDRGDKLPLGEPQLMTSLSAADQLPGLEAVLDERDKRFPGCDWRRKREIRKDIKEPQIHPDADYTWKKKA